MSKNVSKKSIVSRTEQHVAPSCWSQQWRSFCATTDMNSAVMSSYSSQSAVVSKTVGLTYHLRDIAHHTPVFFFVDVRITQATDVDFHLTKSCSSNFMYPPRCRHASSLNKHIEDVHSISLDERPNHLQYCSHFTVSGLSELGQSQRSNAAHGFGDGCSRT
jgi:hypothetical protein